MTDTSLGKRLTREVQRLEFLRGSISIRVILLWPLVCILLGALIWWITRNLKYQWQTAHGALKLEDQLQQGLYPRSAQLYATIVDRNGTVVTSTLGRTNAQNIADRDYFKALK